MPDNQDFKPLADTASAQDIARRIAVMIDVLQDGREYVLSQFAQLVSHTAPNPRATAALNLKDTLEAAAGKREIGQFLRRFLTQPGLRHMLEESFPAYERAILARNAEEVAKASTGIRHDIVDAPAAATFSTRPPRPL